MFRLIPSSNVARTTSPDLQRAALESLEKRRLLSTVTFAPVQHISDYATPVAVAVADMNGDGKPDLVTADYGGTVGVLLGNGDGTFAVKQTLADNLSNGAGAIAVAEFDTDNNDFPDVAVTNGNGAISILLGDGDGTLKPPQQISTLGAIKSLIAADVTGDGKMDLIAADGNGDISVFLGNGDGTFSQPIVTALNANGANQVVAAHFVNGGPMDLAVTNYSLGTVSILIGNNDGTFHLAHNYSGVGSPSCIATADFNGDGNADLVVGAPAGVSVLLGNGNGTFKSPNNSTMVSNVAFITTGDLNGDGTPDLVMSIQNYQSGGQLAVAIGNGNGTFQTPEVTSVGNYPQAAVVADIDGDGRPDIVVAVPDQTSVAEFLNTTDTLPSIAFNAAGVITAAGTTGNDTISLSVSSGDITVKVDSLSRTFTASTVTAIHITSGAGNDSVRIAAGAPAVSAKIGGGVDTLVARNPAADTLRGGAGQDSIKGGSGNDLIVGGNGNETITAGNGHDVIRAGSGANSITAGNGADVILALGDGNTIAAGMGNDTIVAGNHSNVTGGGGDDLIWGVNGHDTLIGNVGGLSGTDTIYTSGANGDSAQPGPDDLLNPNGRKRPRRNAQFLSSLESLT